MRQQLFSVLVILLLLISLDAYILGGLLLLSSADFWQSFISGIYITLSLVGYYGFYRSTALYGNHIYPRPPFLNLMAGVAFTVLVSKLVFAGVMASQDIIRTIIYIASHMLSIVSDYTGLSALPSRWEAVSLLGVLLALIPFFSMLYGITKGKYRFTVDRVDLKFKNLPEDFDGFKIVQISDVHSGSWDDVAAVARGVKMIQDTGADMILFTGDLVNQYQDEINPYMHLFAQLRAPFGKYAVLGNHDYYGQPRNPIERQKYWDDFYSKYQSMGFDLILNSHRLIVKGISQIALVGVENWGGGRWFPKIGDLDKALQGVSADDFTVLMSHDPTHWDEKVIDHRRHIDLTLSGHTHGMQFGINIKGLQWSPVKYRYHRWIGLHEEKGQKLYINRGFGFLGFPGRVGMWPEITVLTFNKDV